MKNKVVNSIINFIKKYYNYDNKKILELKYGIEVIYLSITKIISIILISYILNINKELMLFLLFYGILRIIGFGAHAKSTLQCWILSIITFTFIPILIKYINIPKFILILLSIPLLIIIYKYAPADTEKRILKNKNTKTLLKYIELFITICYIFTISFFANNYYSNILFYSILTESILILPITYKILGVKYNNYLLLEKGDI